MKPTAHTASSERHVQQAIYLAESDRGNHNITSLKTVNSPASEILPCRDSNPPPSPAGAMTCWRSVARRAARRVSAERAWPESSRRAGPPTCHLAADRARLGGATSVETRDSSIVIVQLPGIDDTTATRTTRCSLPCARQASMFTNLCYDSSLSKNVLLFLMAMSSPSR